MASSLFDTQGMADHLSHEPAKGFFSQYGQAFQIIGIGCQSPAACFGDQIGIRVPESADLRGHYHLKLSMMPSQIHLDLIFHDNF